ncbi:MAG: AAA family ATPase [Bacteroidota bacterium]
MLKNQEVIQSDNQSAELQYKYRDLRVYASTEWLAGNRKKYRQVFEQDSTSYIYIELSFVNKSFEQTIWDANIVLRCYQVGKSKKEMCVLDVRRQISKHDNVVYIREGWGHKELGGFWKHGKYCWEAYIDDRKVATKYFYVEDLQTQIQAHISQALSIKSVEYFEGKFDQNNDDEERVYYVEFDHKETRYVFVELTLENRIPNANWYSEIFIKFYNEARELKGEVIRLQKMKKGEDLIQITAGWGSNVKGSWRRGRYSVEVIFQDRMIAESSFVIGEDFQEGNVNLTLPEDQSIMSVSVPSLLTSREAFNELNSLVGLNAIKRQISEHTRYIKFLKLRRERGFSEQDHVGLHSVFTGNPGTGKTTVARLLGAIYHSMGLLSQGHVHEVDRVDLVGEYIGQTAPKVREALTKAKGGVLFIDEAYALARQNEDSKDFGREVIELLVKEMGNPKSDIMVVVAGYPKEMDNFVNSNPGLRSRFKYFYNFEDYTLDDLQLIVDRFCNRYEVVLSPGARTHLNEIIQEDYRDRDRSFGNARYIGQLVEKSKINMGIRLMEAAHRQQPSHIQLKTIMLQDVLKLRENYNSRQDNIGVDEKALAIAINKLDRLIGLNDVKTKVHQLVDIVRYRSSQQEITTGMINMHTIFVGNPGTGKTTVARILADVFKALGVLSKGHIVETDRQGLVAGYVGQTALKTKTKIEEALGGVLFIDEAYALTKVGATNDFGDEAIQVLLKEMEDRRGEFFVFVAGYPKEMERFLSSNPGLHSRFDHHLEFEDFGAEQLRDIANYFIQERGYKISSGAILQLEAELLREYHSRDRHFGNARRVRQYIDELIKQQNLRLGTEKVGLESRYRYLIKGVDVQASVQLLSREKRGQRGRIGF